MPEPTPGFPRVPFGAFHSWLGSKFPCWLGSKPVRLGDPPYGRPHRHSRGNIFAWRILPHTLSRRLCIYRYYREGGRPFAPFSLPRVGLSTPNQTAGRTIPCAWAAVKDSAALAAGAGLYNNSHQISPLKSTPSASAIANRFLAVRFPASDSPSSTRWI